MTYALVGLCVLLGGLLAPSLIWLHGETQEVKRLRVVLEQTQAREREYQSQRDVEVAAHEVTKTQLKQEQALRSVAEAARNEAQRKARAYLTQNLAHASEKEIDEAVTQLFTTPLSLAPDTALMRPGD